MERMSLKIRLTVSVFVLIVALPTLTFAQTTFNQIISFGASLSDPGNAFELTGEQSTPPYDTLGPLLIPSSPYAKGGHHFSNGDTWIEQFARIVGLAGDANSAFLEAGANYAVGGARAYDASNTFNLSDQVNMFLVDFDGDAPSDALYTIEIGGNDVRDAFAAYITGSEAVGNSIILEALESIFENIFTLYAHGARQFLVWNAPDVGRTPALAIMDALYYPNTPSIVASAVSSSFNSNLVPLLVSLSSLEGIQIDIFDSFGIMGDLVDHGEDYGLVNTENACIQPDSPPFKCKNPDAYLFWDGIHPTKAVHAILAEYAAQLLAEP